MKMTIIMGASDENLIWKIASSLHITEEEVFRKSLQLMALYHEAAKTGGTIAVKHDDGTYTDILVA